METNVLTQAMRQSSLPISSAGNPLLQDDEDDLLNALMSVPLLMPAAKMSADTRDCNHSAEVATRPKRTREIPRKRTRALLASQTKSAESVESVSPPMMNAPSGSSQSRTVERSFSNRLHEAGCRRVPLEEAMNIAEKFVESTANHLVNRGMKLDQNSVVFHVLCTRQLVLEKLRAELITRNLCPITLHSLCSVFAMCYCSMAMCIPM